LPIDASSTVTQVPMLAPKASAMPAGPQRRWRIRAPPLRVLYTKVTTLNVYATLENPAHRGARLRLSLDEIARLHSRRSENHDGWFPTREPDCALPDDSAARRRPIIVASSARCTGRRWMCVVPTTG
jgi:hypothetical protein